jgi:hypothetical protein
MIWAISISRIYKLQIHQRAEIYRERGGGRQTDTHRQAERNRGREKKKGIRK